MGRYLRALPSHYVQHYVNPPDGKHCKTTHNADSSVKNKVIQVDQCHRVHSAQYTVLCIMVWSVFGGPLFGGGRCSELWSSWWSWDLGRGRWVASWEAGFSFPRGAGSIEPSGRTPPLPKKGLN